MKYTNSELQKVIESIDVIMNFMIKDKDSYDETFVNGSEIQITQNQLLDLRNEAEKCIYMNNNS